MRQRDHLRCYCWQERISTRIRAAAMGIEEETDMRDNRKEELTTNRLEVGHGREREAMIRGRFEPGWQGGW